MLHHDDRMQGTMLIAMSNPCRLHPGGNDLSPGYPKVNDFDDGDSEDDLREMGLGMVGSWAVTGTPLLRPHLRDTYTRTGGFHTT